MTNDIPGLPQWMAEKLAKIAATMDDIWGFEQEEVSILAAAIRNFPDEARVLPGVFREKVQRQKPREMDPFERAVVILVAYDWHDICDAWQGAAIEEKALAQFAALAFALRQGGEL